MMEKEKDMGLGNTLPQMNCPNCGHTMIISPGKVKQTTRYEDCLRKCVHCEAGYSNATTNPTLIWQDYHKNVPSEVRHGLDQVLDHSINERNQKNKKTKFAFSTSEDAITWSVFRYLQKTEQLAETMKNLGLLPEKVASEPDLILWGVHLSKDEVETSTLFSPLVRACDTIGEKPRSKTEPDVVVDAGEHGLIIIEVKYRSGNEYKDEGYSGWDTYLSTTCFQRPSAVRSSGLYELARNWRIGCDLATGRKLTLVNLVRNNGDGKRKEESFEQFCLGIDSEKGTFKRILWCQLLGSISDLGCLKDYLRKKGLLTVS